MSSFFIFELTIFIARNGLGVFDFMYKLLLYDRREFYLKSSSPSGRFVFNKKGKVDNVNVNW